MEPKKYETVFILTPVLPEDQAKDMVASFKKVLTEAGADLYHDEEWGIRKLAYPIVNKNTGYYSLFEYHASGDVIDVLETAFRRDERVLRFLTVSLDKHAAAFSVRRRNGEFNKKSKNTENKEEKAK